MSPRTQKVTRYLAGIGTTLAWLPFAAPILFSLLTLIRQGVLRFDFLMPAELFPMALAGGLLLAWAARRARQQVKRILLSLAAAVFCLVGSQVAAVLTGLASGSTTPTAWQWALVIGLLMGYCLALAALGLLGIGLWRSLAAIQPTQEP